MSVSLQSVVATLSEQVSGLSRISGDPCVENDPRLICHQDQRLVLTDRDLNGDGQNERITVRTYKDHKFAPRISVDFRIEGCHDACTFQVKDRLRMAAHDFEHHTLGDNLLWRRTSSDAGVRVGDTIDYNGQPWRLNAVSIPMHFMSQRLYTQHGPMPQGTLSAKSITLELDRDLNGPGVDYVRVSLDNFSTLHRYRSDLGAEVDAVMACVDQPNGDNCRAAAQASHNARTVADRLQHFERTHYQALVNLAEYGALLVGMQAFDRIKPEERSVEDYRHAAELRSAMDRLPSKEALFQQQTCMAQFSALFGKDWDHPLRHAADRWLEQRFGLGLAERKAVYEALR